MNLGYIRTDFVASVKGWLRSPGTVFWTILFPVLLIMIFGAIFSGADEASYDLVVQNLDVEEKYEMDFSKLLIENLNQVDVLKINVIIIISYRALFFKTNNIFSTTNI